MASQFSGTNGTDIKPSVPAGASKNLPPLSTKPSTLTPQTQLTGAAALTRQRSASPKIMPEERKNTTITATATPATTNEPPKQSPNPAALLTAGFGMSTPADAPREGTPSRELGSLPGVAAAAAAMEERESPTATPMSGTDGAGLTTTAPPQDAGSLLQEQYQPLQPQPPTPQQPQMQPHPKDTGTPVTPGFGPNPTTPVTPFSPSGSSAGARGKHTCPHCMKTFTRHHNLKSHLLTHAHEKPYLCTTCQARFRRLHDLKRHSKLHTGERPHVCNKCGRRFARGDALARHARGEGGCAGRRGSMSGLNEDGSLGVGEHEDEMGDLEGLMDDPDGDVMMDDVGSPAGASGNATAVGGRRRQSLPSLRTDIPNTSATSASAYTGTTAATPLNPNSGTSTASSSATLTSRHHPLHHHQHHHPHHNNTYPPPSGRSLVTAPATTNPQSTTSTTSSSAPGQASLSASTPSPSLFTPGISFNRTPVPVTTSAPSTTTTATTAATATTTNNTVLSPAGVLTDSPGAVSPGMTRERTPSFTSSGGFLSPPGPAVVSSGTAGGRTGGAGAVGGGAGSSNVFASGMDGVWAYIRNLEDRVRVLEERAGGRE